MKKASNASGVDQLNISPIRGNSKHQMTPLKLRRKISRKDQEADVHTTCSTPNRLQASVQCSGFSSPDSLLFSQENRPDVVWDYSSPKPAKGSKKLEIKITVDEFLKNLSDKPVPECDTQNSHYIKLLEKWMTKQNTPVIKKPHKTVKRDNKKRRVIEEIKEFMESLQRKNDVAAENNKKEEQATETNFLKPEISCNLPDRKSFLEGDSTENDSTDDLWGEMDNSFIVKATQQLDVCYSKYDNVLDKNLEIISTIPETVPSTAEAHNTPRCESEQNATQNCCDKVIRDADHQAQILLTQIINCDWESGSDNDDWDNGFIEEDEALSLIPDEVLNGANTKHEENLPKKVQSISKISEPLTLNDVQSVGSSTNGKISNLKNNSEEISFGCSENEKVVTCPSFDASGAELFNNFEDESFSDESILCKPEVLSWIDQIESQVSQSQPRCTPEEIEKKKDEAIQRRKRNKTKKKPLN